MMMSLTTLLVIFALTESNNFLRTVLGIAFVVFFPGYALQAALFPGQKDLRLIERIVLSFALSIAVVPPLILFLNYTPWGITLSSVIIILGFYVFLISMFGIYRRSLLPEDECFKIIVPEIASLKKRFKNNMIFYLVMIGVTLFSLMSFHSFANTSRNDGFSEFYLKSLDNGIENFTKGVKSGSKIEFVLGVRNFEFEDCDYTIKIYVDSRLSATIGPFNLKKGEKREEKVSLSPGTDLTGNAKVECILFKNNDLEPYRSVHLWIE